MKKIIAGIAMVLLVSSISVYATGGGKKKSKKGSKTECCSKTARCEDPSKSSSAKVVTEDTRTAKIEKKECCTKKQTCAKQD